MYHSCSLIFSREDIDANGPSHSPNPPLSALAVLHQAELPQ
jgi:hypothetical protein